MKFKILPLLLIPVIILFSFALVTDPGLIKGAVTPVEGVGDVWAINDTDSLKVQPVQGAFQFSNIQLGTYKIIVEAKAPYKSFIRENVVLKDGEAIDLGNIALGQ